MAGINLSERLRKATLQAIQDFTLFDDTFMSKVFEDNPECTEYVLKVILNKELKVLESRAQYEIKNLHGHSVRLDIRAVDTENRIYNIEVQRENSGAKPRRARYNSALLDSSCADSGEYGENLPETYVIFITEKDYWKRGKPLYCIERKVMADDEEIQFNDGLHIIYVNGGYRGDDAIGRLMHDFSCAKPEDMESAVLRRNTAPYKQSDNGGSNMCQIMENLNKMAIEEDRIESAMNFLRRNVSPEIVADSLKISKEQVLELQKELLAEA